MKRLNLLLIVAAFFALTTACSDAEKLTPYNLQEEINFNNGNAPTSPDNFQQVDIDVDRAEVGEASQHSPSSGNCSSCDNEARADRELSYGKLFPAYFMSCGTYIQKNDGSLLRVMNPSKIPENYLKTGSLVSFRYVAPHDNETECGSAKAIQLTEISFLKEDPDRVKETQATSKNQTNR